MYDLDKGKLGEAEAGMTVSVSSLPFPAPIFYVVNGGKGKSETPVIEYGGWATDAEDMDTLMEEVGRVLPGYLIKTAMQSREGDYEIYTARSLIVSVACYRSTWINKDDNTRNPEYVEGSRRHIQALAVMAIPVKKGHMQMWGPVVLSAKGFQAKFLLGAIDEWSKYSAAARAKFAPGIPSFMFYSAIGTFGDKPVVEMVGSGNNKSPITPIGIFKTELTAEKMEVIFGGEALLDAIVKLQSESKQWISAWNIASRVSVGDSLPTEYADVLF